MKTKFTKSLMVKLGLIIGVNVIIVSCLKNFGGPTPVNKNASYDLDVPLLGPAKGSQGSGFIKFRQNPDSVKIVTLDTRVSHLQANHAYILERAVNPFADSTGCTSTSWLKLGAGLTPLSIHTDGFGNGEADLWRDVSSVPSGTAFHIHFQVIDSASSAPVLISDCYNYMVR